MAGLKTMRDVRSLRSVTTRTVATNDGAVYLQLHRLATEKLRLEREAELWLHMQKRIEMRMAEIGQQMEHLRQTSPGVAVESRTASPRKAGHQVTLEY